MAIRTHVGEDGRPGACVIPVLVQGTQIRIKGVDDVNRDGVEPKGTKFVRHLFHILTKEDVQRCPDFGIELARVASIGSKVDGVVVAEVTPVFPVFKPLGPML